MRRMILSMAVSLDGCIAGADGNLDWFLSDAEFEQELLGLLRSVDGMLFGRVAYELLAQYWPTAGTTADAPPGGFTHRDVEVEFARLMNSIPKIVYSRSLQSADWGPVTIERRIDAEQIARRKREDGKDLVLFAGSDLASGFIEQDLIDEYRLMFHPVVLGDGIPLFKGVTSGRALRLSRTRTFPSGVVLLQYERNR